MKKRICKEFWIGFVSLSAFVLWTVAICLVDVQSIGPEGAEVGFATVNQFVHNLTGVNWSLYTVTDWLGLVPVVIGAGFAVLGLAQWISRKSVLKVDYSLLALGGFYFVVVVGYICFERFVINYRPVMIDGCLEASYPSSTTLLVMCVMPTAVMQFNGRIKSVAHKKLIVILIYIFIAFMVIGRIISGVHWITDIIGGALFSIGLVAMYSFVCKLKKT